MPARVLLPAQSINQSIVDHARQGVRFPLSEFAVCQFSRESHVRCVAQTTERNRMQEVQARRSYQRDRVRDTPLHLPACVRGCGGPRTGTAPIPLRGGMPAQAIAHVPRCYCARPRSSARGRTRASRRQRAGVSPTRW